MAPINTIVFGATGGVGSFAARTAQSKGAKVFLAMRDTSKPIPGLDSEEEQKNGFERVQADLTEPETLRAAVQKTQAKRAFFYLVFGAPDHMRSSIVALKESGVEFVVFLSSYSVQGDVAAIPPSNFIAWQHAQVEIVLEEVFGQGGYVAVRPWAFASNILWYKGMIQAGEVKIPYPEAYFDYIAPKDIGTVCGMVLAKGFEYVKEKGGNQVITLCGPEMNSQGDTVRMIGRVLGKDIKVTALSEEEGVQFFMEISHLPESAARHFISELKNRDESIANDPEYLKGAANVKVYTERGPTSVQEWVEENKEKILA